MERSRCSHYLGSVDKARNVSKRQSTKALLAIGVIAITIALTGYVYLQNQTHPPNRPQEPEGPFPYIVEEVSFKNEEAQTTLSGTLTLPFDANGKYPAVVLISGSGPQNRDGEWMGHKPFLIIADYLTRKGIAVLRYDDRGFGKSTGDFHSGTSLDFSTDVESAVEFLKTRDEIDTEKIGLIGHSDGAMIAPMVAVRSADISFIVMLAGPGILGSELMVRRQEFMERRAGKTEPEIQQSKKYIEEVIKIVINSTDENSLRVALETFAHKTIDQIPEDQIPPGMSKEEFISRQVAQLTSPWFKFFFKYDPQEHLRKVKCPVLALTGDKDVQAPAADNLEAIKSGLQSGGNSHVTIKELKGINHMMQECTTGMMDEYARIDQTLSPRVLDEISRFVLAQSIATASQLHEP